MRLRVPESSNMAKTKRGRRNNVTRGRWVSSVAERTDGSHADSRFKGCSEAGSQSRGLRFPLQRDPARSSHKILDIIYSRRGDVHPVPCFMLCSLFHFTFIVALGNRKGGCHQPHCLRGNKVLKRLRDSPRSLSSQGPRGAEWVAGHQRTPRFRS